MATQDSTLFKFLVSWLCKSLALSTIGRLSSFITIFGTALGQKWASESHFQQKLNNTAGQLDGDGGSGRDDSVHTQRWIGTRAGRCLWLQGQEEIFWGRQQKGDTALQFCAQSLGLFRKVCKINWSLCSRFIFFRQKKRFLPLNSFNALFSCSSRSAIARFSSISAFTLAADLCLSKEAKSTWVSFSQISNTSLYIITIVYLHTVF